MKEMRDNEGWYGSTMETERHNIEDPGSGRPIILRKFEFKYPPGSKVVPTKKQLLTKEYIKHLEDRLWADNLELIQTPKVAFHTTGFTIFATCQAKKGNIIPGYASDALSSPLQDRLRDEGKDNG